MKTVLPDNQQLLVQWVSQATGISTFGVKVRLQGNNLHILCEGSECPQRWRTLSDLLQALQQTNVDTLTNGKQTSIYQVFVYGRKKGENRPKWCHRVYLNQLERHLEEVNQALITEAEQSKVGGAIIISNESLARQGRPEGIARYLSETLSTLGVSVEVKVRKQKPTLNYGVQNRLWIFCQSSYSPDPALVADAVASKLRSLKLTGYQDAVVASQVGGESTLDWLLRVDLTPPEVMLKEWARWGDGSAITRLLNDKLSDHKVAVSTTLTESTLHVFCTPASNSLGNALAPDKTLCVHLIRSELQAIAPQSILSATLYGNKTGNDQPDWIDWLSLPANEHPALAVSPLELATSFDEPALIFLLERLLNPDLDLRLKTGGIRVILLRKSDLLHVMCDSPICPRRKQVAPKVIQFIQQLKIPQIKGVRIYGRRAGNKEPLWQQGTDFERRQRLVPEATPEFAATSAHVRELLTPENEEPVVRSDLTTEELNRYLTITTNDWFATAKKLLLETQLFVENERLQEQTSAVRGRWVALVWGALGLLLTLQADWLLGHIINRTVSPSSATISASSQPSQDEKFVNNRTPQAEKTDPFTHSSLEKSSTRENFVFNASQFTQTDDTPRRDLAAAPLKQKATSTAILLAAREQIPNFNTRQLEEQLALYRQRLLKTGRPPSILIIGSSRALRGIDPVALSQGLATQHYSDVDVFNFGINGATSQVVNFVLRQVLKPSELPKLIIWADGSRAFNSGREDVTFKAIASSPGYQQVSKNSLPPTTNNKETPSSSLTIVKEKTVNSYQSFNQLLNQSVGNLSSIYQKRDKLKSFLAEQFKYFPIVGQSQKPTGAKVNQTNLEDDVSLQAVDFDGFLPLSIRFDPVQYYQKHPKVFGDYDNDYKSFQLGGEQDAALQGILQFTQSQKIALVFVNMPLTGDYLDQVRSRYEQQFQQYMQQVAAQHNFIYRDFSQLWPKSNDYFSDPSHLNRYGAYEISKKLANDPMIPWPSK